MELFSFTKNIRLREPLNCFKKVKDATVFERRTLILYSFILNVVACHYVELELRGVTGLHLSDSKLEKGNGELYTLHGNLDIAMI